MISSTSARAIMVLPFPGFPWSQIRHEESLPSSPRNSSRTQSQDLSITLPLWFSISFLSISGSVTNRHRKHSRHNVSYMTRILVAAFLIIWSRSFLTFVSMLAMAWCMMSQFDWNCSWLRATVAISDEICILSSWFCWEDASKSWIKPLWALATSCIWSLSWRRSATWPWTSWLMYELPCACNPTSCYQIY